MTGKGQDHDDRAGTVIPFGFFAVFLGVLFFWVLFLWLLLVVLGRVEKWASK